MNRDCSGWGAIAPLGKLIVLAFVVFMLAIAAALTGCGSITYDDSASSGLKAGATFGLPANPCDDGACAAPDNP